jgi:anthranilate synthase component 1
MPEYRDTDAFARRFAAGRPFAVWARMDADLLTAVAAYMKIRAARSGPAFLLESVEGGAVRGRYSMIGVAPDLIWRVRDGRAEINRSALARPDAFVPEAEAPLPSLRRLVAETAFELDEGLPPMSAGLFGYLGYDMVRQMERLGAAQQSPIGVPEAIMVRPTAMIVFDDLRACWRS